MKKLYESPEMEVVEFEAEDVITDSCTVDTELGPDETPIIGG